MEKYGTARQATDGNIIRRMRFACWITKATDIHSEYVILCFSTATMVTRTRLSVTLYVHCLSFNAAVGRTVGRCRREGRGGSRYKLPGPGASERGPGPDYVPYVFVYLGSTTVCRLHKLTPSDQAQAAL